MKITSVDATTIHIPLTRPVFTSKAERTFRDHTIVKLRTDEGLTGWGYTYGYGASSIVTQIVRELLAPIILDQDPFDNERLWDSMFYKTHNYGRKGVVIRAISAVDIAIWDLKGKATGLPVYKLLGAFREKVPVYISGGYYRKNEDIKELQQEMETWAARGYAGVKMRVGLLPIKEDMERVRIARRALGDEKLLMLDAERLWEDVRTAVRAIKSLEEFDPYWIESPASLNKVLSYAKIRAAINTPIAAGGQENTRWGFLEFIRQEAIDILQADATVVGGVTEWLKVAHIAEAFDLKISPHAKWDIHCHLAAATPNALFVEYFEPSQEVKVFDKVLSEPISPIGGFISPPDRPGFGMTLDEQKLERFKVG